MLLKASVALLYLAILIVFAVRARRRTRNVEDYYVGGRNVPTLLVVLSFYATFVSTNTFIGHSAKSYVYGVSWLIVGIVLVALTYVSWRVIAPRFRERAGELGSVVPSDLFRLHFQSPAAGAVAAGIILFDSVFFLAAVLLGASESMAALFGMPFALAITAVFAVQIIYTTVGGYLADVWSDSLQAIILLLGAILLPIALVKGVGGWAAMTTALERIDSAQLDAGGAFSLIRITMAAPLLLILGIGLSGGLKFVADPRQLSRFYGLRSGAASKQGIVLVSLLVGLTYLCLLPIGLFTRAYPLPPEFAARTDAIVPWLLGDAHVIGPAFGTIILLALLAAAMSTIDSVLLVAAGAIQQDVLPLFGRTDGGNGVGHARQIVFACALLSLGLAIWARAYPTAGLGIVELTVLAGAVYAGAFLPGLIGILYWRRASAQGAILGMVFGVVSTAMWKFVVVPLEPSLGAFPEVFIGLLFGTLAFVAGSVIGPPASERSS